MSNMPPKHENNMSGRYEQPSFEVFKMKEIARLSGELQKKISAMIDLFRKFNKEEINKDEYTRFLTIIQEADINYYELSVNLPKSEFKKYVRTIMVSRMLDEIIKYVLLEKAIQNSKSIEDIRNLPVDKLSKRAIDYKSELLNRGVLDRAARDIDTAVTTKNVKDPATISNFIMLRVKEIKELTIYSDNK